MRLGGFHIATYSSFRASPGVRRRLAMQRKMLDDSLRLYVGYEAKIAHCRQFFFVILLEKLVN